jgi:hypothetical protein
MATLEIVSGKGTNAVRKLREQKLKMGLPFMINTEELASNECYLEYPDGSIKLIAIMHAANDINVIRELTKREAEKLRNRFHFSIT